MTNAVINSPPEIMLAILICPKMVKRQDLIPSAVLSRDNFSSPIFTRVLRTPSAALHTTD